MPSRSEVAYVGEILKDRSEECPNLKSTVWSG